MAETKINHGVNFVDDSGPANPPPYTPGPQAGYPHPQGGYPYPQGGYPQPSGGYPHPPPQQGPTIVQATVVPVPVMMMSQMGPNPARVTCKSCSCEIVTRVETKPTMRTHLFAALLCLLGCWPCVCVPYCMDSCMNTDHYCTNCGAYVGSYLT